MLLAIGLDGTVKTEPLTCRHRCFIPLIWVSDRGTDPCTTHECASKASSRCTTSATRSGGTAVLQPQQAHFAIVDRFSTGDAHFAQLLEHIAAGCGDEQAANDRD